MFLRDKAVLANRKRKIDGAMSSSCALYCKCGKEGITGTMIPIDFVELLTVIILRMDIQETKIETKKLDCSSYKSWIRVRCARGAQEVRWLFGARQCCRVGAKQELAKTTIRFLQSLYWFEVRDVNYNDVKNTYLFSIIRRDGTPLELEKKVKSMIMGFRDSFSNFRGYGSPLELQKSTGSVTIDLKGSVVTVQASLSSRKGNWVQGEGKQRAAFQGK